MNFRSHGGNCCGISHLYGMNIFDFYYLKYKVSWAKKHGHLLEVVVTDYQLNHVSGLKQGLKDLNFRLVSRFYNGNSCNYCNVFHFHRNPKTKLKW